MELCTSYGGVFSSNGVSEAGLLERSDTGTLNGPAANLAKGGGLPVKTLRMGEGLAFQKFCPRKKKQMLMGTCKHFRKKMVEKSGRKHGINLVERILQKKKSKEQQRPQA